MFIAASLRLGESLIRPFLIVYEISTIKKNNEYSWYNVFPVEAYFEQEPCVIDLRGKNYVMLIHDEQKKKDHYVLNAREGGVQFKLHRVK